MPTEEEICAQVFEEVARLLKQGIPLAGPYGAMEQAIVRSAAWADLPPSEVGRMVRSSVESLKNMNDRGEI